MKLESVVGIACLSRSKDLEKRKRRVGNVIVMA